MALIVIFKHEQYLFMEKFFNLDRLSVVAVGKQYNNVAKQCCER